MASSRRLDAGNRDGHRCLVRNHSQLDGVMTDMDDRMKEAVELADTLSKATGEEAGVLEPIGPADIPALADLVEASEPPGARERKPKRKDMAIEPYFALIGEYLQWLDTADVGDKLVYCRGE